jgi:hypothetical protein
VSYDEPHVAEATDLVGLMLGAYHGLVISDDSCNFDADIVTMQSVGTAFVVEHDDTARRPKPLEPELPNLEDG